MKMTVPTTSCLGWTRASGGCRVEVDAAVIGEDLRSLWMHLSVFEVLGKNLYGGGVVSPSCRAVLKKSHGQARP